jgi:antitoxin (DNA-binding transcriptional repressor) of toxin-antitoxin stability system
MPDRTISVTEAARNFSDLVNRVFYSGESATLVRGGVPVARMIPAGPPLCPASRLAQAWPTLPHLSPADARRMAADIATARAALPAPRDPWA